MKIVVFRDVKKYKKVKILPAFDVDSYLSGYCLSFAISLSLFLSPSLSPCLFLSRFVSSNIKIQMLICEIAREP